MTQTHLPTVAIKSQSERTDRMTKPLDTTAIEYRVDPSDPWAADIYIIETPDREMLKTVIQRPFRNTKVLFRMRGDPYWGIHHWIGNGIKRKIALWQLSQVDGCLAIARHQAEKYVEKARRPTHLVPLSIDTDDWPTVAHQDGDLRIVSLTNLMYPDKIDPIVDAAPAVDDVLAEVGGYWRVCGRGKYEDRLRNGLSGLDHVEYAGYVDATDELANANVMVHLSELDVFANAMLEGMASNLPVVTNPHPAFTPHRPALRTVDSTAELCDLLKSLRNSSTRQVLGERGREYVNTNFTHERVGEIFESALVDFHQGDYLDATVLDGPWLDAPEVFGTGMPK